MSKSHVDFLAKVKFLDQKGDEKEELFHVEFQAHNDRNMPQRMLSYMLDIHERFHEVPSQIVVYVGKEPLTMSSLFQHVKTFTNINYQFKLIDITSIPSQMFLKTRNPDLALLGVLGRNENIEDVLNEILVIIQENSSSSEELIGSVTKLELIGQLRGVSHLVYEKVSDLLGLDIRKLESYKLGKKEGRKEGRKEGEKALVDAILSIITTRLHPKEKQLEEIRKQLEEIHDLEYLKNLVPIALESSSLTEFKKSLYEKK